MTRANPYPATRLLVIARYACRCVVTTTVLLFGTARTLYAQSLRVPGLRAPVDLTRDSAGVVHIRAANEHDLFFAQGYNAARDRLFQLELWRRQATGTMAEVLGSRWVARDRASRLFALSRFDGDRTRTLSSARCDDYHRVR